MKLNVRSQFRKSRAAERAKEEPQITNMRCRINASKDLT